MSNENIWNACLDCGQRVGKDSIHTCSPQLKPLNDDEIIEIVKKHFIGAIKLGIVLSHDNVMGFARAIEQKHGIK